MPIFNYYIELAQYALLAGLALFFCVQMFFYLRFYTLPFWKKQKGSKSFSPPVSVIICAKNEAENLKNHLPAILDQDYENYEVIVVNDCSEDDTDYVVSDLMIKHKNLHITNIQPDRKFLHGKKLALTIGIKSAKNEHLVFTDADCKPNSRQWLKNMAAGFSNKGIVLGYGGYYHQKGLLNLYLRYDTAFIATQYFGFALRGLTYMGVGRNLAYKKNLFFENKGFASHYGLISGDDDLFINEVANKNNVAVCYTPDAHTRSVPKTTWGDWFKQKIRHVSTAGSYKKKHIFLLGLEPISRLGFYLLLALNLALLNFVYIVAGMFLLRLVFQCLVSRFIKQKLNDKKLFLLLPIFDIVSLFINFTIYLTSLFRSKKLKWT